MIRFDAATVPLEPGVTLIEASAGTGKTYSIAALFLRFVLEEHLPVQKILAVTFGVAATRELRDRVRARLRDALGAIRKGDAGGEPVVARFLESGGDAARAVRELELAVHSFDEAPIFTIHGFCQRALGEHAFESGTRYGLGSPMQDAGPLLEEVAHDFWRAIFYDAPPVLAALALSGGFRKAPSPEAFAALLKETHRHPGLAILPEAGPERAADLAPAVAEAFEAAKAAWKHCGAEVATILKESKTLSRAKDAFRADRVEWLLMGLANLRGDDAPDAACVEALASIADSVLAANVLRKGAPPQHPFFTLCETFRQAVERFFARLPHDLLAYAGAELASRKLKRNLLTFDDLLTRLHRALHGENGDALATALGGKYAVALLDEFQDTDPLQAAIFKRLFATGTHWLYFIGDPKQAIYGFRGADIFAYLKAAASARRRYNLETNWRSGPRLLEGFNALFTQVPAPFVFEEIEYHRLDAAPGREEKGDAAPLVFRRVPDGEEEPLSSGAAQEPMARAAAADIARMHGEGRDLKTMAVLVRNRNQASRVQKALKEYGVRSVLHTEQSVFTTGEAAAMQHFLEAVAEPRDERRLKAALAGPLFGWGASRIAALEHDETERELWLGRFAEWHGLWSAGCFIAMFRRVLVETAVRQRFVEGPDGERRLTNLLHLAELLHDEETARKLAPEALCGWLRQQREGENAEEVAQLRLESDEEAVEIVTVHKSKGLEYPVVFCPFLWTPADSAHRDEVFFHDSQGRFTLDLRGKRGSPPEHLDQHRRERLAEEIRLVYVAVTRAREACWIYFGSIEKIEQSPLGHLFPGGNIAEGAEALAEAFPAAVSLSLVDDKAAIPPREAGHSGSAKPEARHFPGHPARPAFVTSFTGLTAGTGHEEREHDLPLEAEPPPPDGEEPLPPALPEGIFAFPRGASAGDFFHDVLEHLDFTDPDALETLVPSRLALHGFGGSPLEGAVKKALRELLEVELEPGLALGGIAPADRLSEVEFSCRLPSLEPGNLESICGGEADPALAAMGAMEWGRLRFSRVSGYLRGAIDLLFRHEGRYYLVDWKSNWLGDRPADYDAPGIAAAMREHHYALQAHLYVLAADRFLAARLPGYDYERDFGGVFYLFLRGIDRANPQRAVCRIRPPVARLERLRRLTGGPHS